MARRKIYPCPTCVHKQSGACDGVYKKCMIRIDSFPAGQLIAASRDAWFNSFEGELCLEASAGGVYLRNRLERAFLAGVEAGRIIQRKRAGLD